MNKKEKYLQEIEIKVKNILSDLFQSESIKLKEINRLKNKLGKKISLLENEVSELRQTRQSIEKRYDTLKEAGDVQFASAKNELENLLNYIDNDKETFIKQAEEVMQELQRYIHGFEIETANMVEEAEDEFGETVERLKGIRKEIEEKVENVKKDSSEKWKDIKAWFDGKRKSVREYIA